MAIFNDIELEWNEVPYRIKGDDEVMKVLAAVEDHITLVEVEGARTSGRPPFAKLSAAYAAALRFAGCRVSAAQVYEGMWTDGKTAEKVGEAIAGLLQMMVPITALKAPSKSAPAKKKTTAAKRSRQPTKPQ